MPAEAAAVRDAISASGRLQVLRLVMQHPGITREGLAEHGLSHGAVRQASQDLQALGFLIVERDGRGPGSGGRYRVDRFALTMAMLQLTTWLVS